MSTPSIRIVTPILLATTALIALPAPAHAKRHPPAPAIADRDVAARLKTYVEPRYPESERQQNLGGVVTLKLQLTAGGDVAQAVIEKGISPALDQAAVEAAQGLKFHPAIEEGRAVPTILRFEYRFVPPGHTHTGTTPGTRESTGADPSIEVQAVDEVKLVEVEDERPLTAASAQTVRDRDLRLRPMQRPSDLFRVTPGLMAVQHAGGGKANQYLLRGFDADHGTDIALSFDGLPLNMVSHGHGQGYADANWIIPELVERVEISKGPYFVEKGDFATAGAVDLVSRSGAESFISAGGGSFDTLRGVAIAAPTLGTSWQPLLAAELVQTDGPFEHPEDFKKYNLYGKLTYHLDARSQIAVAASAYNGSWNASGQLPDRAVRSGQVGYFGALDPSEGGSSSRENVYATLRLRPDQNSEFNALAYRSHYDFNLYSNFTLFSRDPVNGDEIQQTDERSLTGGRASYRWLRRWRGMLFDSTVGGTARADSIHNGLAYVKQRERLQQVIDADIAESSVGVFAKEEVQLVRWLRLMGGVRFDHFTFAVDDRLEDLATQGTATSGSRGASRISPKATAVVSPHPTTDLFVNFGYGFHSNDARGVVRLTDPVTPLTRAVGYELGARTRLLQSRLDLAVALWGLDIDSEIVWVGDEGTTEASGATRRLGVEAEARLQLRPWLFADLDVTWSDAKFKQNAGNAGAVALAPRLTVSGGLSANHASGARGGLRGLHIAERPATEDGFLTAEPTTLVDLFAAYRWRSLDLSLTLENLLDRRYRSAQFATVTRLANEAPTNAPPPPGACPAGTRAAAAEATGNFQGCEDVSFSPGNPFSLRLMASYYF
jgi:TonB family protein